MIEADKVKEELARLGVDDELYEALLKAVFDDPIIHNTFTCWRVGHMTYARAMTEAALLLSEHREQLIKRCSDLVAFQTTIQVKT